VSLASAELFTVLAATAVSNIGVSVVNGNVGTSPGTTVTGFPPGLIVNGAIDVTASQAETDASDAYLSLSGLSCCRDLSNAPTLGSITVTPGVYCFSSNAQVNGPLILDGQGNANAVWVFKVGGTLSTGVGSLITVANAGLDCNVYWAVGGPASLGTTSTFVGNVLAVGAISAGTGTTVRGRLQSTSSSVSLDTTLASNSTCDTCSTPVTLLRAPGGWQPTSSAAVLSSLTFTLYLVHTALLIVLFLLPAA
jgi:hypothetical protein